MYEYNDFEKINIFPQTFNELLNAPSYIINLDRQPDRYIESNNRIVAAGFKNSIRVSAIDASDNDSLKKEWELLNNPKFNNIPKFGDFIKYITVQGIFLSHIKLWQHIVNNKISYATIFEDDILFHSNWDTLTTEYFNNTPKNYDMFFIGGQINLKETTKKIACVPVWCLHAYVITYNGAKKLLEMILNFQDGLYAIDRMIANCMKYKLSNQNNFENFKCPFIWYVWVAVNHYPCDLIKNMKHEWKRRNHGLIFQDQSFGSTYNQFNI